MPKDYRERRIDIEPPRLVLRYPKKTATPVDPDPAIAPGLYSPGVTLLPGDGVLWYLRLDYDDASPSAFGTQIVDNTGSAVTFSRVSDSVGGSHPTYWLDSFFGNTVYDSDGTATQDDYIYAIWEQFTGFTPGTLYFKFNIPGTARARVEAAFMVRGVDTAAQGEFQYFLDMTPEPSLAYDAGGGESYNAFPYSVPLTADNSVIFMNWGMQFSTAYPGGYNSAPGTAALAYTETYAPDPIHTTTLVTYIDDATGATESLSAPSVNAPGATMGGMAYYMSAIVLNSLAATSMTVYPLTATG